MRSWKSRDGQADKCTWFSRTDTRGQLCFDSFRCLCQLSTHHASSSGEEIWGPTAAKKTKKLSQMLQSKPPSPCDKEYTVCPSPPPRTAFGETMAGGGCGRVLLRAQNNITAPIPRTCRLVFKVMSSPRLGSRRIRADVASLSNAGSGPFIKHKGFLWSYAHRRSLLRAAEGSWASARSLQSCQFETTHYSGASSRLASGKASGLPYARCG